jgi:hypothetical protein
LVTAGFEQLVQCCAPLSALAALLLPLTTLAQTHPLNDTGQTACYDATTISTGTVSANTPDPETDGFDKQDCTQGRAAADAVGVLYKVGGSSRLGADYTRIANNGSELPGNAALGSGPNDWGCTRDNLSGLVWEVKVNDATNLRHQHHTYTWYDTDTDVNGGNAGTQVSNSCNTTVTNCNTTAFRDVVNTASLCGASDWRLPTADELLSLVHHGLAAGESIDTIWFPNSPPNLYWSGQNYAAGATNAWIVNVNGGGLNRTVKSSALRVRLVRSGQ